jgi:arylsulfatase A-like enzyme
LSGLRRRLSRALPPSARLASSLALLLLAAKAIYLGAERPGIDEPAGFLRRLACIGHADVLFAAAFGAAALALLAASDGRPLAGRAARAALVAAGAACAGFAIVNLEVFAYLRAPLTRTHLMLADSAGTVASSIGSFLTPLVAAGLLGFPALYAALALPRLSAPLPRAAPHAALFAAAFVAWGAHGYESEYGRREDYKMARSPHATFLLSWFDDALPARSILAAAAVDPTDLADFAPSGERAAAPASRPWSPPPGARRPRNVVLLVLESTGARYLSLHGSRYDTTPSLVREARHALVFDAAYAHVGRSSSSLVALFLSAIPPISARDTTAEFPGFPGTSVAARLGREGMRTSYLSAGDLRWAGMRAFAERRGFARVEDAGSLGSPMLSSWSIEDRVAIDAALGEIDAARAEGRPFLVVCWTEQAHHPYEPTPGVPLADFFSGGPLPRDDWDLGRYLNVVRETDRHVGRLFEGLRARGIAEETLVVVTGDHGEGFGDPHETWGHGGGVYEQDVRVPLMLWCPGLFTGAGRTGAVAGLVDVAPTIADVLGLAPAPDWQGRSLLSRERPERAYFFSARDERLLGVREGSWKYVLDATRGEERLHDLERDPEERADLSAREPARTERLRRRVAAWVAADERRHGALLAGAESDASTH